jgi:hypothetical protein
MYDNSNGINSLNYIKSFKGDGPATVKGVSRLRAAPTLVTAA